jgi:hypothetical protein
MALPFFNPLFDMLPDGGIYDPESGLSYIGPGARVPGGGDPDTFVVPTTMTPATAASANQLLEGTGLSVTAPTGGSLGDVFTDDKGNVVRRTTYASGRVEDKIIQAAPRTISGATTERDASGNLVQVITYSDGSTERTIVELASNPNPQIAADAAIAAANKVSSNKNAREFLIASLKPYFTSAQDADFLTQLTKVIDDYISQDYDVDTISVLLPQTDAYKTRFKGNTERANAGLSMLSPAEYIQAEEQYNEILKRFNLGDLATRDTYSTLIGGQVSAAELTDRVVNVYDRVRNADPALRAEIDRVESLGGGLTDADFAKALLTGPEGANELKRKISVAEITAEARVRGKRLEEQGYLPGLSVESAGDLQRLGVTRAQARAGFEQIALTQPRLSQLSEIYTRETPEATELQTELEREQFQGLSSERRRRLAEQETASFMGSSGTQGIGLRGRSRRGQI